MTQIISGNTKLCNHCGKFLSLDSFWIAQQLSSGYQSWCKDCSKRKSRERYLNPEIRKKIDIKNKQWKINNLEKAKLSDRNSHLKRTFGITLEDYDKLLKEQKGVCKICKGPERNPRKKILSVDHDHITGRVRGLLCDSCNNLLARACDNTEILKSAISYLELNSVR